MHVEQFQGMPVQARMRRQRRFGCGWGWAYGELMHSCTWGITALRHTLMYAQHLWG